jgi:hypothetical protein
MKKWLDRYESGGLVSKNSLNRKVTCSNCGWSWKLSDGGEDPLTCHKCGSTIKMKHGGELDKYKEKGEVKQSFRDQLLERNGPIIDKTAAPILLPQNLNYDKTRVVNNASAGLNKTQLKNVYQDLRNRAEREKKQKLEEYKAAKLFHENNPVAKVLGTRKAKPTFVKPTARELAYGLGAGINDFYDVPGIGIANDFVNPLSVVSKGIISPWAQAPLQAQQSDSYFPYLGAAASTALTIPMVKPALIPAKTIFKTGKKASNLINQEVRYLADELDPFIERAKKTFYDTYDLPLGKRLTNAFNSGTLGLKNIKDVPSHYWGSNMTVSDVRRQLTEELENLPKGAYTTDGDMSINAAPIFWRVASKGPEKGFTIIRTGGDQTLNFMGYKGDNVAKALPKNYDNIPKIKQLIDDFNEKIKIKKAFLPKDALKRETDKLNEKILQEIMFKAENNPEAKKLLYDFYDNYKPILDHPIIETNKITGLNFPLTSYENDILLNIPTFSQPELYGIKGSPLKDRFLPYMKNYAKDRIKINLDNFKQSFINPKIKPITNGNGYDNFEDIDYEDLPFDKGGSIITNKGQMMQYGGLTKYKEKGEVVNPNNPIQLSNVNFVYKRPVVKSTFNPYENVNRVGTSDNTKVFRLNPEQVEKAKEAAAIRNEKIIREYYQNNQSFIGPDNRTKAERDRSIAARKAYDDLMEKQQVMSQQPFYQTLQNTTAGGYNPNAAYNPVIGNTAEGLGYMAAGALGSSAVRPAFNFMGQAMNLPIQGVPGFTGSNIVNAAFATHGLKSIMDGSVTKPWKEAYRSGNPWDYANAVSENAMTALELAPLVNPGYKGALEAGNYAKLYAKHPLAPSSLFRKINSNLGINSLLKKYDNSNTNKAIIEHLGGIIQSFSDKRPFFEKFPITLSQKRKVYEAQDNALKEGLQFMQDWHYNGKLDLHPDIIKKMQEIDPSYNPSFNDNTNIISNDNPFNEFKNILVSSRRNALNKENISNEAKQYLLNNRSRIAGVNMPITNESITLRNRGLYYLPPSEINSTVVHETGHTGQKLGQINIPFRRAPFENINTLELGYTDYYHANPNSFEGSLFKEAMVEPVPHLKDAQGNIIEKGYTWEASPGELHSELYPARKKLIDAYVKQGHDKEEIMNMLRSNPTDEQIDWMIDTQNLNRFFKKTTSPELKRKVIRMLYTGIPVAAGVGALNQKQKGGAIITNRGQWDYPGQTTIIPSNKITMEGVPYPVLGVDNTGYVQMMQPQMNYTFPGQYVTEYPMAKNGVEVKKTKPIVKKPVYQYTPQNLVAPSFSNLGKTTYSEITPIDIIKTKQDYKKEKKRTEAYVNKQTAKAKEFHTKWMHSPMYKEMLKNSAGINAKNINNARLNNLNNIKVSYNPVQVKNRPNVSGASFTETGDVEIYPKGVLDNVNNLGVHEFSHSIDRNPSDFFNRLIPSKDLNKIKKYANKEYYDKSIIDNFIYSTFNIIEPKRKPYKLKSKQQLFYERNPETFIYRTEPTETRARLNDIRQAGWEIGAYDPFTEKVNKNIFNKLDESKFYLENNGAWSPLMQLQKVYTNDQIIDLLNTVSKNNKVPLNPQIMDNNNEWEIIG